MNGLQTQNPKDQLISFLLRVGVSTVFLYAATASFLEPTSWIGFLPAWIRSIIPFNILLIVFSIYELILALWILSNKKIFYSSSLAALTLLAIIIFNIHSLDIVFRDFAILFSALALAVWSKNKT